MKLSIKDLCVEIDKKIILNHFNLDIEPGSIHAIMGPNGVGKSTLSRIIMGDSRYHVIEGDILFEGESILKYLPDERSRKGIFLSMQSPMEIDGVSNQDFLRTAVSQKNEKKAFLNCHNQNSLVLSIENDTKLINFETNHQGQSIKFSLNKNIYFFFDNQKIDSNRDYYDINGNDIFKFQKPYYTNEGIFQNDYMYYDANSFSLICPLNITVCYPSCSDCDANKIGNSTYNYCNKCSTNYFTLYNASKSSFNCYNFQENMEEYYFNEATQKFEKCNESCYS